MFVSVKKNMYDIDTIMYVSDNEQFVATSDCGWIAISDTTAQPGEYLIDGAVYGLARDNYHVIEKIIFEIEERHRIAREAAEQKQRELDAAEIAKLANDEDQGDLHNG
jgi:hypothetical protein